MIPISFSFFALALRFCIEQNICIIAIFAALLAVCWLDKALGGAKRISNRPVSLAYSRLKGLPCSTMPVCMLSHFLATNEAILGTVHFNGSCLLTAVLFFKMLQFEWEFWEI